MTQRLRRPQPAVVGGMVVGLAAGACVALLSMHGPDRFLDSGSYAAVIDSLTHGDGATSTLAASFSHFSAAEFITRGGRIPFVDFPLGYPLVATIFAWLVGVRRSMMVITILSSAAIAALATTQRGDGRRRGPWYWCAAGVAGVGLVVQPGLLAMTRAGLSEPLFIALILGSTVCSVRAPDEGGRHRLRAATLLVGCASLIRFVGLAALVVPAVLLVRRDGLRRSWAWVAAAAALPIANVAWAASVGGGHQVALRELTEFDVRVTFHSVTGWFVNHYGSYMSVFRNGWPPVWGIALGGVWVAAVIVAIASVLAGRGWMPRALEIPFAMAGMLTVGLYGGMLWFDSLVTADVRLMGPAGVLTLLGLFWWAIERLDERAVVLIVVAWVVVALAPWRMHLHVAQETHPALIALTADANIVISDSADVVWWETGVPSAYLPLKTRLLTGEAVDQAAELAELPCLLQQHGGIIVLVPGPFVDTSLRDSIAAIVAQGALVEDHVSTPAGDIVRYRPTSEACVND